MAGIPSSQITVPSAEPEAAPQPESSNAVKEYQASKNLLDEMVVLRERQRANGGAVHPALDRAIEDQMGVVGRRQYWLDNPAPPPAPVAPALQQRSVPQAQPSASPPAQALDPQQPAAPMPQVAQPAKLEWNASQQQRTQWTLPPQQPLAAARPQPVMTLPPQQVMTNSPQELQSSLPQMLNASPSSRPMQTRDMPAPQTKRGIPSSELSGFGGPRSVPSSDITGGESPLNWSDIPSQALRNLPSSAGQLVQGIAQPFLHPIDTISSFADIGRGVASKVIGAVGGKQDAAVKARTEAAANALGAHFAERYGTIEGFKKALATDPVGIMADAATVLSGGSMVAARVPGAIAANTSRALATAANAVDPIANAGRLGRVAGNAVTETLGVTTGASSRPLREAYAAGQGGNQAFVDNMRGQVPVGSVVDMAENAVGAMGRDRSANYNAGMAGVRGSQAQIDFAPVQASVAAGRDMAHHSGVPISQAAAHTAQQLQDIVDQFQAIPGVATADRFDAMKRAIGEVRQATQQGTLERTIADRVYRDARAQVTSQVPEYAAAMADYANASENIGEMRRTMSINDRAAPDTTLRKLQSTMRNNVNTNYGARERLLDVLAHYEPDLPAALAGQSLNALAPRGLARVGPVGALYGGVSNPSTLAALPFASPRLMGEAYHGAGQANQALTQALLAAGLTPDVLAGLYRGGYVANAATENSPNALSR